MAEETTIRKISREQLVKFREAEKIAKTESERIKVVCTRCKSVLFEGTAEELGKLAGKKDHVVFRCDNPDFVDEREPQRETILNEKGEREIVEIEREHGCKNVVTQALPFEEDEEE